MKLSEAVSGFDSYSRRARIYPAMLAVLPVALISALLTNNKPLVALSPILLSAGTLFLASNIVRVLGQRAQQRLIVKWDGMPTTKLLRFREAQNSVLLQRRRQALEVLFGAALPTRRQEAANLQKADEAYIAATRCLITHVRSRPGQFPLIDHENAAYGFARNLLGIKPLTLGVLMASAAADAVIYLHDGLTSPLVVVGGLHLSLVAAWLFFIRPAWVRQAAETYAERLLEALDLPAERASHEQDGSADQATSLSGE
ncbi:hypothetical protein AB0H28_27930 [Micromonospora sp. NPDC050980]|uniref:hypothetical protein n=1 Tax=Micromonospora sp. NPDC050980 TaxID=3155161 RepID=UPI00341095C0